MKITSTSDRAWAVASALAAETGLGWGLRALGIDVRCSKPSCNAFKWVDGRCAWCGTKPRPVLGPWDADAYLADCARRQAEPGPLPSLFGVSSGVSWSVDYADGIHVVFYLVGGPAGAHAMWFDRGDRLVFFNDPRSAARSVHPREIVGTIHCLATAAKRATESEVGSFGGTR